VCVLSAWHENFFLFFSFLSFPPSPLLPHTLSPSLPAQQRKWRRKSGKRSSKDEQPSAQSVYQGGVLATAQVIVMHAKYKLQGFITTHNSSSIFPLVSASYSVKRIFEWFLSFLPTRKNKSRFATKEKWCLLVTLCLYIKKVSQAIFPLRNQRECWGRRNRMENTNKFLVYTRKAVVVFQRLLRNWYAHLYSVSFLFSKPIPDPFFLSLITSLCTKL